MRKLTAFLLLLVPGCIPRQQLDSAERAYWSCDRSQDPDCRKQSRASRGGVSEHELSAHRGTSVKHKGPLRVITAETDMSRTRHGTVEAPTYSPELCQSLLGKGTACVPLSQGPLVFTDFISLGEDCEGQTLALVRGDKLIMKMKGPFDIQGARLVAPRGTAFMLAQKLPPPPKPKESEPTALQEQSVDDASAQQSQPASGEAPDSTTPSKARTVRSAQPIVDGKGGDPSLPVESEKAPLLQGGSTSCGLWWSGYAPYDVALRVDKKTKNPYEQFPDQKAMKEPGF